MIIQGGWNFAPQGWAMCNGQILSISQNQALFALLGTTFGGNGQTTFALPDLRGRAMIHQGQGPGLSSYVLGESGGIENASLNLNNLPSHTHTLSASTTKASLQTPAQGSVLGHSVDGAANPAALPEIYCPAGTSAGVQLGGVGLTGSGLPFSVLNPFLTVTIVIALQGIFPSRN
jgi:microcystin-dependent protein